MAYAGSILKAITVNNAYGATDTDRPLVIPLSAIGVDFDTFASDGRDLDLLASDQETSLAHQLIAWNSSVGLHLDSVTTQRSGNGTYDWNAAVRIQIADLEDWDNGPHVLWSAGNNQLATWRGELVVYDKDMNYLGVIPTPNDDYVMGYSVGDVDGDGKKEIVLAGRYATNKGSVIRQDGAVVWDWSAGVGNYVRLAAFSEPDGDGNVQVAFGSGGTAGKVTLREGVDGTQIWENTYTSNNDGNSTIQGGYILDATGTGHANRAVYFVQGSIIRKVNYAGSTVWTYTYPGMDAPIDGNFYELAAGRLASTTSYYHVAAFTAMPGSDVSNLFWLVVVNDSGALVWEKAFIGACFNVACADINGDGYDEIIVGLEYGQAFDSHGGVMILDRNGEILSLNWLPAASRSQAFGSLGSNGDRFFASSLMQLYAYKVGGTGASVQVILPSVTATESQTIYLAKSDDAELIPPFGAYYWDLSGSNGSAVPDSTTYGSGTWTIEDGAIQSNDTADTAQANYLDFPNISADAFEFEFTCRKPSLGTGGAATYNVGIFYGASNYTSGRPDGYYLSIDALGDLVLQRRQTGTGTVLATLYTTTDSGLTFTTSDTIRCRVTWSGNQHSLQIKKNSGEWTTYYRVEYDGASNITTAGSIALINVRGQTRYWDLKLRTLPREFGGGGVDYGPYSSMEASDEVSLWQSVALQFVNPNFR